MNETLSQSKPIDCSDWAGDVPQADRVIGNFQVIASAPNATSPINCSHWSGDATAAKSYIGSFSPVHEGPTANIDDKDTAFLEMDPEPAVSGILNILSLIGVPAETGDVRKWIRELLVRQHHA